MMFYIFFYEVLAFISFVIQTYNGSDTYFFENRDIFMGRQEFILDKNCFTPYLSAGS